MSETAIPLKQRLFGLFCLLVGAGIIYVNESSIYFDRIYYLKAALFGPNFIVFGLGLLIFPGYRQERMSRGENISQLKGAKLITLRWWCIIVTSFLLGFSYLAILIQGYVLLPTSWLVKI